MTAKLSGKTRVVFSAGLGVFGAAGLFFFVRNGIFNYMFFSVPFAFFDYKKPATLVFAENVLILLLFVFIGMLAARLCTRSATGKKKDSQ